MLELLDQGWFGSVVGILGLALAVIGLRAYRASKASPYPRCHLDGFRLARGVDEDLAAGVKIVFRGEDIPRVTVTRAFLWNDGNATLLGAQIVPEDPVRFEFPGEDRILEARVAVSTRSVNKVSVKIQERTPHVALLDFDFLDPMDGVRIEFVHTSKERIPRVRGTIRGVPRGVVATYVRTSTEFSQAHAHVLDQVGAGLWGVIFSLAACAVFIAILPAHDLGRIVNAFPGTAADKRDLRMMIKFFGFVGAIMLLAPLILPHIQRRLSCPVYPRSLDRDVDVPASNPGSS